MDSNVDFQMIKEGREFDYQNEKKNALITCSYTGNK